MADKIVKVAVYARVSTQEQAVEGTSLEHQSEQMESYCKAQGWEVAGRYVDPGFTGKDGDRPALKRLLADADLGVFDKAVVYKLDRLARSLRLLLEIEDKLKKSGVFLYSAKESIDTSTSIGKAVFQVLGLASEWERDAIVERTRSGRIQRYKEGRWAGGRCPYGYSYDRDTKKLVISEPEAKVVRRIYDTYNTGGSLSGIADQLNQDKVKPRDKKGQGWRPTAIRQLIVNPVYKGMLIVNRHLHISDIRKVDMNKAIVISVPAIVPNKVWEPAQKHLNDHKHVRPMRDDKWLLQGLIVCGLCGLSYRVENRPPSRYYMRRGKLKVRHLDGSPRCTNANIKAEWLEEEVWKRIEEIIDDPNKLRPMLEETIANLKLKEQELQARLLPIDKQLTEIAAQKSRLADQFVVSNMNPEKFKQLQSNLEKEETRLRSLRSDVDPEQLAELEVTQSMLRLWESQVKAMAWNLENEDGTMVKMVDQPHRLTLNIIGLGDKTLTNKLGFPTTRREVLDKLQVKVIVFPDRNEVNAVFPIAPISNQKCSSTYQREGGQGDGFHIYTGRSIL